MDEFACSRPNCLLNSVKQLPSSLPAMASFWSSQIARWQALTQRWQDTGPEKLDRNLSWLDLPANINHWCKTSRTTHHFMYSPPSSPPTIEYHRRSTTHPPTHPPKPYHDMMRTTLRYAMLEHQPNMRLEKTIWWTFRIQWLHPIWSNDQ